MKLKNVVSLALIMFATSAALIIFVGTELASSTVPGVGLFAGAQDQNSVAKGSPAAGNPAGGIPVSSGGSTPSTKPGSATPIPGAATPTPAKGATPTSVGGGTPKPTATATPVPTPPPTPAPTPPPIACGAPNGACTVAQVAVHNSQSNCWVRYSGYYYIVTSYVNSHPGGRSVFNTTTCGSDITAYLNGSASTGGQKHTHSQSSYAVLNSYRVGPVN